MSTAVQDVIDSVSPSVLKIWEAVSDKRVTLSEIFEIIPEATKIGMTAVGVTQLTNSEKHEAVLSLIRLGWQMVKDWDIPWVPNSVESFIKGWASPLVEGWLIKQTNKLIGEYWSLNPVPFGGAPKA